MGKFLDEEYKEVEAYSKEEMEAEVKKQTSKFESEIKAKDKEVEEAKALATEKDDKLTKRSEEYKNLKKSFDEKEATIGTIAADRKATFEKMRDDMINKAAGDDKEYGEMLKTQFARVGKETLDATEIESALKDAHSLSLTQMNREYTSFSLASGASGAAPIINANDIPKAFTTTDEGKASLNAINRAMGREAAKSLVADPNNPSAVY